MTTRERTASAGTAPESAPVNLVWRRCIWMLLALEPLAVASVVPPVSATFSQGGRQQADSFSALDGLLVAVALLQLITPYILETPLRRSLEASPPSNPLIADPQWVLLVVGLGLCSSVPLIGAIVVWRGGIPGLGICGWVAAAEAGMLFYSWRHRRALMSGG